MHLRYLLGFSPIVSTSLSLTMKRPEAADQNLWHFFGFLLKMNNYSCDMKSGIMLRSVELQNGLISFFKRWFQFNPMFVEFIPFCDKALSNLLRFVLFFWSLIDNWQLLCDMETGIMVCRAGLWHVSNRTFKNTVSQSTGLYFWNVCWEERKQISDLYVN